MWRWLKRKPHAVRLVEAMEGVDVNVYPPNPGWGQDPRESLAELARKLVVERLPAATKKSSQPPDDETGGRPDGP